MMLSNGRSTPLYNLFLEGAGEFAELFEVAEPVEDAVDTPVLALALFLPLLAALIIAVPLVLGINIGRLACGVISTASLALSTTLLSIPAASLIAGRNAVRELYYVPVLTFKGGIDLFADGLSLPLAVLIALLSTLSSLYSIAYMDRLEVIRLRDVRRDSYYSMAYREALIWPEYVPKRESPTEVPSIEAYYICLLLFADSMLWAVLSTNLIHFLIFYEFVTVPTTLLVYIWGSGPCRLIAIKYFIYMLVGGVFVLLGIAWVYAETGCVDILCLYPSMLGLPRETKARIAALLLLGFGIKASIFPLHTWLPDFHAEAPVPIHALLSGALIKCGVYGIARMALPLLTDIITEHRLALMLLSLATMFWGAFMAVMQRQIKRILAYSSINQMGYITLGLFSGTQLGILGGLLHVITHGIAKDLLLLCAGSVIHATGSRNVDELGGISSRMPITSSSTLVGGLSLAGVPPLAGFMSEWLIFLGVLQAGYHPIALAGMASTAITMGYYLWMTRRIFFQKPRKSKMVHESPLLMTFPLIVCVVLLVALGVYPQPLIGVIQSYACIIAGGGA
ncbi:MAG TPA: NADH-quinone oxidoreductase subunit M [Candidatus Bathyarchaeota archaeon]|nr:NADH-quinone oxidoreductase subunit M [Candidatus Bathyarchaeota archaeon]